MIDLWGKSSRDEFERCTYWKVKENDYHNNQIVYERNPDGFFFAKEINSYTNNNQVLADAFLTEEINITLESHDDLSNLKTNDLVLYDGEVFRVDSIQKVTVKKQRMLMDHSLSFTYYISLRR